MNVFITGGTGTLGRAWVARSQDNITVYSRDEMKQQAMKREFPHCRYVIGDVADYDTLEKAMVGHELVLHFAAFKHIPAGENNALSVWRTNVTGSENVAKAAIRTGVAKVLGISTDKACKPINTYGCSKMFMERLFQQYDKVGLTEFHLCRYGNVLSSTGSVLPLWRGQAERGQELTLTDPSMTRFWLNVNQAVEIGLLALKEPRGTVTIPKLSSMTMLDFAKACFPDSQWKAVGTRHGEKKHEDLLSAVEGMRTLQVGNWFRLLPPDATTDAMPVKPYTSETAPRLTAAELLAMLV